MLISSHPLTLASRKRHGLVETIQRNMANMDSDIKMSNVSEKRHADVEASSQYEVKDEATVLELMGYKQETRRNYSIFSLLGMGFALTNSWWAISASMV